jgi:hypothetical protein
MAVSLFASLRRLNRETDRDVASAIKDLKQVVAGQAAEFAPLAGSRHQFNPAVASVAIGTGDVGFSHRR